jgi:hypothetical protein
MDNERAYFPMQKLSRAKKAFATCPYCLRMVYVAINVDTLLRTALPADPSRSAGTRLRQQIEGVARTTVALTGQSLKSQPPHPLRLGAFWIEHPAAPTERPTNALSLTKRSVEARLRRTRVHEIQALATREDRRCMEHRQTSIATRVGHLNQARVPPKWHLERSIAIEVVLVSYRAVARLEYVKSRRSRLASSQLVDMGNVPDDQRTIP